MKWEYACLVREWRGVQGGEPPTHTLNGPGSQKAIQTDDTMAILNQLGQDGWEVIEIETSTYYDGWNHEVKKFWLKRPPSTGS